MTPAYREGRTMFLGMLAGTALLFGGLGCYVLAHGLVGAAIRVTLIVVLLGTALGLGWSNRLLGVQYALCALYLGMLAVTSAIGGGTLPRSATLVTAVLAAATTMFCVWAACALLMSVRLREYRSVGPPG